MAEDIRAAILRLYRQLRLAKIGSPAYAALVAQIRALVDAEKPMTIDLDVAATAKHFGVDAALIQAVVQAEGDILKAVQCSLPSVSTRQEALEVTCRSAVHAMSDYVKAHDALPFVTFWGARWAPVGADNDPRHVNANWTGNVWKLWTGK